MEIAVLLALGLDLRILRLCFFPHYLHRLLLGSDLGARHLELVSFGRRRFRDDAPGELPENRLL